MQQPTGHSPDALRASRYSQWNRALAERFFNTERAGQRVWLCVTPELIRELGEQLNPPMVDTADAAVTDLVVASRHPPGCFLRAGHGICDCARAVFHPTARHTNPSYLVYLAVFVLAVSQDESDEALGNAYFERLNRLVAWGARADTSSFDVTNVLLEDLQQWSDGLLDGERGWWSLDGLPSQDAWYRVQRVRAQVLLSHDEEQIGTYLLAAAPHWRHEDLGAGDLAAKMLRHAGPCLRPVTRKTLRLECGPRYEALRQRLDQLINDWDREPPENADEIGHRLEGEPVERLPSRGRMWLTCRLEPTGPGTLRATWGLRCETAGRFPDENIELRDSHGRHYWAAESWARRGLSEPLRNAGGRLLQLQADEVAAGPVLRDGENCLYQLAAAPLRVLVADDELGSGLTESRPPPADGDAYLLFDGSRTATVRRAAGGDFRAMAVAGLPYGWQIGLVGPDACRRALEAVGAKLSPPRVVFDGIRSGRRQHWLVDLPPRVGIIGPMPEETEVEPCGHPLLAGRYPGWYELPQAALVAGPCKVTAEWPNGHSDRRLITLERLSTAPRLSAVQLDSLGCRATDSPGICGAWVAGAAADHEPDQTEVPRANPLADWVRLAAGQTAKSRRVVLLPDAARSLVPSVRSLPDRLFPLALAARLHRRDDSPSGRT